MNLYTWEIRNGGYKNFRNYFRIQIYPFNWGESGEKRFSGDNCHFVLRLNLNLVRNELEINFLIIWVPIYCSQIQKMNEIDILSLLLKLD